MFKFSTVVRVISVLVAMTILVSLLPAQTVSGQTTGVQAPYIGIWMSASELASLPTSGTAWNALVSAANQSAGSPDIQNQDSDNDVYVLAKALVYARTGDSKYRTEVVSQLQQAIGTESGGRTLAIARNLVSYVIAADLINLPAANSSVDQSFRSWLRKTLTVTLDGKTLNSTHEDRPNNWGTHAGASRAAVAWYLGDRAELDRTATVFLGWLGDRAAYSGFSYGELSWQSNASQPVGVNPKGSTKNGVSIDGAQPEEMRRAGGFTNPPAPTGYAWEALQGSVVQGIILHRAGYPVLAASDRALLRAVEYLYRIGWKAEGDDLWQPWLINYYYGTSFGASSPAGKGKNMGWTDWSHGARSGGTNPVPTQAPTKLPPTAPTTAPTIVPTKQPTSAAPTAIVPTAVGPTAVAPTAVPTTAPTAIPTQPPAQSGVTTIKAITFEDGKVINGSTGVDRVSGTINTTNNSPLAGSYSVNIDSGSAYLQEDFSGSDEVFVSFLIKLNALPSENVRILFFSNDGTTVGNIVLNKNGSLRLRTAADNQGNDSSVLAVNTTYRVGLYQKRGSGGNAVVMAYLAPAGQAFGSPFTAVTNGAWTNQATFLRFGATTSSAINMVFDNLVLTNQFVP